jgi:phosphate transport system permease protein
MKPHLRRRNFVNALMFGITGLFTLITVSILFFILGYLLWNGARSLNWAFFTQLPKPPGETGGGMANAIVGSAELIFFAVLIGAPVGLLAGIYLSEFDGKTFSFLIRYTTDLLNGVPSIVVGIFAYAVVVVRLHHFSLLAGSVALSVIFIPTAVRTTEQVLLAVPQNLREAAFAVGATKSVTTATTVVPAAFRGLATGMLLAVARVAGETAPLLFTSFNNQFWNVSLTQPTASLPVMIFTYAISPYADWHRQAWAAGAVLLASILLINILARGILAPAHVPR